MATQYKWVIPENGLNVAPSEDGLTDVVVVVHWTRLGQDGEINVSSYGTMGCSTPSSTDFTAYPDLTFEQVCSWLDAGLNVAAIDAGLNREIEDIKNPPIVNLPLPWDSNLVVQSN